MAARPDRGSAAKRVGRTHEAAVPCSTPPTTARVWARQRGRSRYTTYEAPHQTAGLEFTSRPHDERRRASFTRRARYPSRRAINPGVTNPTGSRHSTDVGHQTRRVNEGQDVPYPRRTPPHAESVRHHVSGGPRTAQRRDGRRTTESDRAACSAATAHTPSPPKHTTRCMLGGARRSRTVRSERALEANRAVAEACAAAKAVQHRTDR